MTALTINPQGGPQDVRVAVGELLKTGLGAVVQLPDGQYAEVMGLREEKRRHGGWAFWLTLQPLPTGSVLTGFGEAVDVVPLEVAP